MNRNLAASIFSAFLFAQGIIGFAALATVVLRGPSDAAPVAMVAIENGSVLR